MRWREIAEMNCSIARTLSIVGDRWTLLLLRDCFLGARRFDQFSESLGLSPHLLSTRLAKLVEAGVLDRHPYQQKPARFEYRLTEKGRDLYPVIAGLVRWGDRWMADDEGPPVTLVHRDCGHATTPTLVCSECGDGIDPRNIRAEISPRAGVRSSKSSRVPDRRSP
jgi:DNA-binding HxlR family transcriptional regulator